METRKTKRVEYVDHEGRHISVSEKRFKEYKNKPENNDAWVDYRMKQFGYCREEVIMHPRCFLIITAGLIPGEDGKLTLPKDEQGRSICDNRFVCLNPSKDEPYAGGYYLVRESMKSFATPEEAHEYAMGLPLRMEEAFEQW